MEAPSLPSCRPNLKVLRSLRFSEPLKCFNTTHCHCYCPIGHPPHWSNAPMPSMCHVISFLQASCPPLFHGMQACCKSALHPFYNLHHRCTLHPSWALHPSSSSQHPDPYHHRGDQGWKSHLLQGARGASCHVTSHQQGLGHRKEDTLWLLAARWSCVSLGRSLLSRFFY